MQLLNRPQAAYLLGVSRRTLEKWAVTGEGPAFYKLGARVVYDLADLKDWLTSKHRQSTSDTGQGARFGSDPIADSTAQTAAFVL